MSTTTGGDKPSRKSQILEALATMLEESPGGRITTARLAAQVGVSEAALYRHFPSKARMFDGLIEFIEESVFSRISRIQQEDSRAEVRCYQTLLLLLTFAERNPGISRILTGDPLVGETERLRARNAQFFERLETQLRQFLREAVMHEAQAHDNIPQAANLLLAAAEGKINQFVRSDFDKRPTADWPEQWLLLRAGIFNAAQPPP